MQEELAARDCLGRQLTVLEQLKQALTHENQALRDNDTAALERWTLEKQALLEHYNALESELNLLLPAGQSPAQWLETLPAHSRQLRERAIELARDCQEYNRQNGQIIQGLQARTREAISLLRHNTPEKSLYTSDGQASYRPDTRFLGKA